MKWKYALRINHKDKNERVPTETSQCRVKKARTVITFIF